MFRADSSTLKSDSDVQRSAAPPTIPRVVALSWTARTSVTIRPTSVPGNACLISRTRKLDSSARPVRPRSESARNVSGTNESSAKYAIIAARWVPRSAKNFCTSTRLRTRTGGVWVSVRAMDAARALADLTEISSQLRAAALVGPDGETIAGSERLGRAARGLVEAAQ